MKTSEQIDKLTPAIFALQGRLKPVGRSKVVKTGKYEFRYAPLDSIMEYITPIMQAEKLVLLQAVNQDVLTTRIMHESGQWIESATHLNRDHANMQGFGGEVTYKRRYALSALIGLVSDDDNDAPRHSATQGVIDGLSQRRQNLLIDVAEIIKEKFADGNEWGCYEEYLGVTDQEEKVALWSLLPSNVRTSIKKTGETERQGSK